MDRALMDQLNSTEYSLLLEALYDALRRKEKLLEEANDQLALAEGRTLTPEDLGIPSLRGLLIRLGHGHLVEPPPGDMPKAVVN